MAANTVPIFPLTPINWKTKLTNQTTPRDITTQVPVTLGSAGKNGSLIHTFPTKRLHPVAGSGKTLPTYLDACGKFPTKRLQRVNLAADTRTTQHRTAGSSDKINQSLNSICYVARWFW